MQSSKLADVKQGILPAARCAKGVSFVVSQSARQIGYDCPPLLLVGLLRELPITKASLVPELLLQRVLKTFGPARRALIRSPINVEPVEQRRLLSTSVWTGAGTNNLYSNPANWQSGVVPSSGDDLDFPDVGSAQTVNIDSAQTVDNLFFAGTYTLTGSALTVQGEVEATAFSTVTVNNILAPTANNHFTTYTGATLSIQSTFQDNSNDTFDKYGDGTLVLNGSSNADWQELAGTMTINAYTNINLSQYGGVLNSTSGSNNGGLLSLNEAGGTVDVTEGSILTLNGAATFNGGTFEAHLGSNVSYGQLVFMGQSNPNTTAITLVNSPTLQLDLPGNFTAPTGSPFVIMDGGGMGAISGTFANLPEGGTIDAGDERFSISYQNGDVILTAVAPIPTVALTASSTTPIVGQSVVLTATVTGSGATPTGTVAFSDNGTTLGSGTLVNGVAALTVPSFAVGSHPITATYDGDSTYLSEASSVVTIASSAAPVVIVGPGFITDATAAVSTAKAAVLSAVATDTSTLLTNGLTYTWSIVKEPSGAKTPVFSVNGTKCRGDDDRILFQGRYVSFSCHSRRREWA